jgi:phosphoserine aminotransferase
MTNPIRPDKRPTNPHFSSGPCSKRPGYSLSNLQDAMLGRSHRAPPAKAKLKQAIDQTRDLLGVPQDYLIGIVPASDTGAMEMAIWSLIGARGVDVLVWESFGKGWASDVVSQLKVDDARVIEADYGSLPDLAQIDFDRDIIFTWNGTTSGVRVPDGEWIADQRDGLTLCDATSAVFAQALDWPKLDVVTFSWQKVMGGEAQHGMLILSPRAVERLESYQPPWPMPKIFRLTKGSKLIAGIFEGATINTPSMLCVEDYLDALSWAVEEGGAKALMARSDANAAAIEKWVEQTPWVDFLAKRPETRSNTSVCLKFVDPEVTALEAGEQSAFVKKMTGLLNDEKVAFDIGAYRDAPPGLRIWAGATIETADIEALMPWLDWAFATARADLAAAA